MKKYALALDLVNDEKLISEYEEYHKNGWTEITKSIIDSGITSMEIYRIANHLFMVMETTDDFTFENKKKMDEANEKVLEWEELMWKFQQPLPGSAPGEKWQLMKQVFELKTENRS